MAKKAAGAPTKPADEVKGVIATLPEMVPTQQDGIVLLDWFNGLIKWSQRVYALEQRAKQTALEAQALTEPKSKEEDEALQLFIRRASADTKEVESAWDITAVVSRFHKRLTGARSRTTNLLDTAKARAQRLHNDWNAAEKRRVDEENARRRREAEELARKTADDEAKKLEDAALERESAMEDLSDRERVFVERFANSLIVEEGAAAIEAAKVAGFKDGRHGLALLQRPKIADAIKAAREAAALRVQAIQSRLQPLNVQVEEEVAQVADKGDRTTWSADVFDVDAWRQGIKDGSIPLDTAVPHGPTMNNYARSLRENLNRWPGCRAVSKTTTV